MKFADQDWAELVSFIEGLGGEGARVRQAGVRESCERFLGLLLRKNEQVNLTAVTDPRQALWKHFADSFAVLAWEPLGAVVDWGSGGGFPGIPLAIVRQQCGISDPVWFVDSVGKKVRATEEFCSELQLSHTAFFHARGEALMESGALREVRSIVMRAVAPAERAVHWIDPRVSQWIFLLGPQQVEDWRQQERVLQKKKMAIQELKGFSLPHSFGDRFLLKISSRSA